MGNADVMVGMLDVWSKIGLQLGSQQMATMDEDEAHISGSSSQSKRCRIYLLYEKFLFQKGKVQS